MGFMDNAPITLYCSVEINKQIYVTSVQIVVRVLKTLKGRNMI